jgi:hypothetical protein
MLHLDPHWGFVACNSLAVSLVSDPQAETTMYEQTTKVACFINRIARFRRYAVG